jgi:hypothetical protein
MKPCVFNGVDFQYWKAKIDAYIQAQGYFICEKVTTPFVIPIKWTTTIDRM